MLRKARHLGMLIFNDVPTSSMDHHSEIEIVKDIEVTALLVSLGSFIALLFMVGSPLIVIPASIFLFGEGLFEIAKEYRILMDDLYSQEKLGTDEKKKIQTEIRLLIATRILKYALIAAFIISIFIFPPTSFLFLIPMVIMVGAAMLQFLDMTHESKIEKNTSPSIPHSITDSITIGGGTVISSLCIIGGAVFSVFLIGSSLIMAPMSVFVFGLILWRSISNYEKQIIDFSKQGYSPEEIDQFKGTLRAAIGFQILTLCAVLAFVVTAILFPPVGLLMIASVALLCTIIFSKIAEWGMAGRLNGLVQNKVPDSVLKSEEKTSHSPAHATAADLNMQPSAESEKPKESFLNHLENAHTHKYTTVKTQDTEGTRTEGDSINPPTKNSNN